jgi:hypothetical protein
LVGFLGPPIVQQRDGADVLVDRRETKEDPAPGREHVGHALGVGDV